MVPDGMSRLVSEGNCSRSATTGFWRAVDTFKDRAELEEMYLRGHCPWMLWDGRAGAPTPGRSPGRRRAGGPLTRPLTLAGVRTVVARSAPTPTTSRSPPAASC